MKSQTLKFLNTISILLISLFICSCIFNIERKDNLLQCPDMKAAIKILEKEKVEYEECLKKAISIKNELVKAEEIRSCTNSFRYNFSMAMDNPNLSSKELSEIDNEIQQTIKKMQNRYK